MTRPHAAMSAWPSAPAVLRHLQRWGAAWALTALLAFLVLYPLGMLIPASFQGADGHGLTIDHYAQVFSQSATWQQIWATVWMAVIRAGLATSIGIFLAWVVTRTDTPWRGAISFLVWVGYFAPTLPILVAWVLIAGRVGILNSLLQQLHWIQAPIFEVYSYAGIIWVSSLNLAALVYILIEPVFRSMDSSLEEGARMCGASRLTTLMRITIPAMSPAILGAVLYSFVLAVESFEPELLLGTPAHIYVLSTRIFSMTQDYPQDVPGAAALSTFILSTVTVLLVLQRRLLAGRSFVTVTGRGAVARIMPLGRWRWLALALCVLYFLCATVLPVGVLVLGSFTRAWGIWRLANLTLDHWSRFLSDPRLLHAIGNTIELGVTVGMVGTLLCAAIAYLTLRTRFAGRGLLTFITWAPRTAPAVVAAVAYAWAFISGTPIMRPLLGTVWILAIVLTANTLPVGARTVSGALHQIGPEMEQAARISGASWWTSMGAVLLPLLAPALLSSFVLLFLLAGRNLALVLYFYTPSSRVLSTVLWEAWTGNSVEQGLVAGVIMMLISCVALAGSIGLRRRYNR